MKNRVASGGFQRKRTVPSPFLRRECGDTSYDVEMLCSLSTVFRTVGRFIMRSCHAV